jgi:hypothetical protein
MRRLSTVPTISQAFAHTSFVLQILLVLRDRPRRGRRKKVARVNVSGNGRSVIESQAAAGLNVLFGGVEVFEVRTFAALGWKKILIAAGMILLVALAVAAWVRGGGEEITLLHVRQGVVMTGLAALYGIWVLRQVGVVWRFDHKRKTITRRHWLRGLSRNWKSGDVTGLRILNGKSRLGVEVVQLGLVNRAGELVAEVGSWDKAQVDVSQVELVVGEIKKVMWWR